MKPRIKTRLLAALGVVLAGGAVWLLFRAWRGAGLDLLLSGLPGCG